MILYDHHYSLTAFAKIRKLAVNVLKKVDVLFFGLWKKERGAILLFYPAHHTRLTKGRKRRLKIKNLDVV
jgi:hypothetical protein